MPTLEQDIQQLIALRLRKGISLSAIAAETRIRAAYLSAIEAGKFALLPGGAYRINYVRQYAGQIDSEICARLTGSLRSTAGFDSDEWSQKRPYWWANRFFSGLAVVMAMVVPVHIGAQAPAVSRNPCPADNRCEVLVKFFKRYGSPLGTLAGEFLRAADENRLDWRLLPGLSMVETSGGKHARNANVFGWNSGLARFDSVSAGIRHVAARFGNSQIYRGKTTEGILRQYNPARAAYPPAVMRFIDELPLEVAINIAK
ncbi:MAG: helix-turn-helix transcriptional regulator [Bryobacteraceae bacterium]